MNINQPNPNLPVTSPVGPYVTESTSTAHFQKIHPESGSENIKSEMDSGSTPETMKKTSLTNRVGKQNDWNIARKNNESI